MGNEVRVVQYTVKQDRHARRGHPAIKAGTTLYILQHVKSRKYFVWAYLDKDMAEMIAKKIPQTWRETDLDFNFKSNPEHCVHTYTKIGV